MISIECQLPEGWDIFCDIVSGDVYLVAREAVRQVLYVEERVVPVQAAQLRVQSEIHATAGYTTLYKVIDIVSISYLII